MWDGIGPYFRQSHWLFQFFQVQFRKSLKVLQIHDRSVVQRRCIFQFPKWWIVAWYVPPSQISVIARTTSILLGLGIPMKSHFPTWEIVHLPGIAIFSLHWWDKTLVNLSTTIFSGDGLSAWIQLAEPLIHATSGPRLTKRTFKGSYSGET